MDAATFRSDFPAFASTTKYPDAQVNFWLNMALIWFDPVLWDNMLNYATELFVAHNLAQQGSDNAIAAFGGAPGLTQGVLSSKSVAQGAMGFDTGATTVPGAGNWNATSFGVRLYELMNIFGSGGMQL